MIREATAADIPDMVEWGREFFASSHWAALADYDAEQTAATLGRLIEAPEAGVFVSDRGLIIVLLVPLWFSTALTAQELFFWVADGQGAALRKAAETWAAQQGAAALLMGAHEPGDMDRIDKWYRRGGYAPHGRIFRKVMANGH